MTDATRFVEKALRDELRRILETLPANQQKTFTLCLAPGKTLDTTSEEVLRDLYNLCMRTVRVNEAKAGA